MAARHWLMGGIIMSGQLRCWWSIATETLFLDTLLVECSSKSIVPWRNVLLFAL